MNIKSRCYTIVLYPENKNDMITLSKIISLYDYAYILHDKDVYLHDVYDKKTGKLLHAKGEVKKPHYHVLIYFDNARSMNSIKEVLDVDYIEKANFYLLSRYLIHIDYKEKYQYPISDIVTNIPFRISRCLEKEVDSSESDFVFLYKYCLENHCRNLSQLTNFAIRYNLTACLRKNVYYFIHLCKGGDYEN